MRHIKSVINVIIFILITPSCFSLSACQKTEKPVNNEWWKDSGTTFVCKDGDIEKTIEVQVDENRDGSYHISFTFCVYGGSSCILDSISDEVTILEEDNQKLYSYTGKDVHGDQINIIYTPAIKTLSVTSYNELLGAPSNYDVNCSGTYNVNQ